jgi:hypothetical protein
MPQSCTIPGCARRGIVLLSGWPLCSEHYVEKLNELNDLGLTPGNLSREGGPDPRSSEPARITEEVRPPAQERERS